MQTLNTQQSKDNHQVEAEMHYQLSQQFKSKLYLQEALKHINISLKFQQNNANAYILRGEIYLELDNFQMALQDCNIAINIDQTSAKAYYLRSTIYWKNKSINQALDDINQAISLNPNFEIALSRKGLILWDQGFNVEAVSYFLRATEQANQINNFNNRLTFEIESDQELESINKVIHINPNDYQAYFIRANIFHARNKVQEAFSDYTKVIQINPKFSKAYIQKAKILIDENKIQEALNEIILAQQCDPNNDIVYFTKGNYYLLIDRLDMALSAYNKTLSLCPNNEQYLNQRGALYFKLRRFEEAIKDFNKAISINPRSNLSYYNRALSYLDIGLEDKAQADFEKHIEINPNHSDAYYQLGVLLTRRGNQSQAFIQYCKAIQLNPKFQQAYANRGSLANCIGLKQQAFEDLNKAIELDPKCSKSYFNRGTLFFNLGILQLALEDLSEAINIDPKNQEALNNRGLVYNLLGQKKNSLKDFSQIIQLNPKNGAVLNNIGNLYFDLGQNDESLKYFLKANECCQNPVIQVNIGNLYFQERKYQLARGYLLQAKELIENQGINSKNNWNLCPANICALKKKIQLLLKIQEQIGPLKSQILYQFNEQSQKLPSVEDIEKQIFKDSNGKSLIQPILDNQDSFQTQREIELLQEKTNYLQEVLQQILQSNNFKIEKEIENLKKKENSHKFIYFQSLVWYSYNYLNSMYQISTGLFEIKKGAYAQTRYEKFIFYLREFLKFTPNLMKYLSMPQNIFNCINQVLGFGMEKGLEISFNNRMTILTNILKRYIVGQTDLEQQIQLAAIVLSQEQQPKKQQNEQSQFKKFVDKIASFKIVNQQYNQDYHWKKGLNDSLTILSYMSEQNNPRINDNSNYNLTQMFIDAIRNSQNNQTQQLQSQ